MPQSFGDDGQLSRPEDNGVPIVFQADGATVYQKELVLVDVTVVGQSALAEKDAQCQVIDLCQVDHGEWLSQPGGLLREADLLQGVFLSHVAHPC